MRQFDEDKAETMSSTHVHNGLRAPKKTQLFSVNRSRLFHRLNYHTIASLHLSSFGTGIGL